MKKIRLSFLTFLTFLFSGFGVFCFSAHQSFKQKTKEIDHMLDTLTKGFLTSDQFAQRIQMKLYHDLDEKVYDWTNSTSDPMKTCQEKLQPVWEQLKLNQTNNICDDLISKKGFFQEMKDFLDEKNIELFLSKNTNFFHQNIDFFKKLYLIKHDLNIFTYLGHTTALKQFEDLKDPLKYLQAIFGHVDFIHFDLLFLNLTSYQDLKLKNLFYRYSTQFIKTWTSEVQKTFHFGHRPSNFTFKQVMTLYQDQKLDLDRNILSTLDLFWNKTKKYGI